MPLATESTDTDDVFDIEDYSTEPTTNHADGAPAARPKKPVSAARRATVFGAAAVVALAALTGWLGFRTYQAHQSLSERSQFLQAARQGATNLTTASWVVPNSVVQAALGHLPVGALANGTTIIRQAQELRVKETDRIAAIAHNLRVMGAQVIELSDGLEIHGPAPLRGGRVHPVLRR